jgi:hypothetical protein
MTLTFSFLQNSPMSSADPIMKYLFHLSHGHLTLDPDAKAFTAYPRQRNFDPDFVTNIISQRNDDDLVEIVLDTGCTSAITPSIKDFVEYHPISGGSNSYIQTASGPTRIAGYGIVNWTLMSENGSTLILNLPCKHVPSAKIRLLSPQDLCSFHGLDISLDHFGGNSNYFWLRDPHHQE